MVSDCMSLRFGVVSLRREMQSIRIVPWLYAATPGVGPARFAANSGRDEAVVCVSRSESRLGVRWKEADGRVFESDESGMVYAVDSRGERIIDRTFRRRRRSTSGPADE
jgi:hypothetical protein